MVDDTELVKTLRRAQDLSFEVVEPLQPIAFAKLFDVLVGTLHLRTDAGLPHTLSSPATVPSAFSEFHALKAPSDHVSRVVTLAFHRLYHSPNDPSITTRDIADSYAAVRQKKPQNVADVIKHAVRRGLIVEANPKDGRKTWVITPTGEKYVNNDFQRQS